MLKYFQSFISSETGYAAPLFAIAAVPILGAVGLAVDYSAAASSEVKLKSAIESTSLTLARMSVKDQTLSSEELVTKGKEIIALKVGQPVSYSNFEVDTKYVSVNISAHLSYETTFGRFVGQDEITVAGLSEAVFEIQDIDFYMVLDNSPSMAVGATPADITALENAVGCAFACHTDESSQNTYDFAKSNGINMRIDAVKDALSELTVRMEDKESINQTFRVSAVSMGEREDHSTPLKPSTLLDLSNDYDEMREVTSQLEVLKIPSHSFPNRQTNYAQILGEVNDIIESDIAKTPNNVRKKRVMFLITDGLNDSAVSTVCNGRGSLSRCMQPIDTNLCDTIKANNTEIAVLHTLYFPIVNNRFWRNNVKPQDANIAAALKECASDGLYYAVDFENGAVTEAMGELFDKTVKDLQLTKLN